LQQTIEAHCLADYQQMQAYNLKSGALPADCQVRNMPRNLWTQYRDLVIAGLAVILLQAVTIGALLQQRRRLRLAEMRGSQQRDELSRAMRFAAMGELTASIAHEINQPLGAILNNAKAAEMLLAQGAETPQELRTILTDIRRDNERAHAVIQRLRRLLSKGEAAHGPVHLHATIQESLAILKPEALRRGITMELDLSAPTDRLSGDSVQLQQVLINLALNAMDAMADTGLSQRILALTTCHHAGQLQLQVRDTGSGIAESAITTIFDSFYTTKSDGMGLGLPIVRTIVQAHHGTVSVDSRPGYGTMFTLRFPLLTSAL
jgi:signal transduction histidine kinase